MRMHENREVEFAGMEQMTYLNTAAEGLPPRAVASALSRYARDKALGMDGRALHEAEWDAARQQAGLALGLDADEVGICSCSSEAFNLAASALRLQPGDEVVINDLDFPAGATPWLQETCPATVRLWRARDWALRVDDLIPLLGPRTRLVSSSLVSFLNGFMIPLPSVLQAIRRHSPALLALDVTQALGRIPVERTDVDLLISSTHKWILGTHGGGLVGVPRARAEVWTTSAGGWFNRSDAFGPDRFEQAATRPGAAGFTVGMPNYPAVYAVHAALGYINGIGVGSIHEYAKPLVRRCLDGLRKLPVELITPDEPDAIAGIVAFRCDDADRLNRLLHERGIHVMSHAGRLRVSIHGYNTIDDVELLLRVLEEGLRRP